MRRTFALGLMSLFITANLFAVGEARMTGKIIDAATKQPIEGGIIYVEATSGKTVKVTTKPSRKDGGFTIFLLDGTLQYKFKVTAPGYTPYEEVIKLKLGETNIRDFDLAKAGAAPVAAGAAPAVSADPSIETFNAGAALSNKGDFAGAMAKFEEAVALKPELTAGWMALAKVAAKEKKWDKAIPAAKKALEIDDEDPDMWSVLYQAYTATGDKANAAIAEKKMPANPSKLFNDAAKLINEGKDSEAEVSLKRAVVADEKFAIAWYELGMVYVRAGKSAQAREALSTYLTLEPNGKDAPTAKEMLSYLQ